MDFPPQNTRRFQPGRGPVPPGDKTSTTLQKEEAVSVTPSPAAKTKSSGPYVYPIHNADRFQGKITFLPIEVNVPKFSITGESWSDFRLFGGNDDDLKQSENTPDITASGDVGIGGPNAAGQQRRFQPGRGPAQQPAAQESSNSTKSIVTYTPMPEEKIILNMPISYVVNDMIGYDNAELGLGGAAALNGLERTGEMGAAVGAALGSYMGSFTDAFKQGMGANAARVALGRAISKAPLISAGLKAAGSIAARVTVNPNVRATFRGVSLREFSFQFKFIPYSAEESRMIADIIRTFRIHAYPEAIYAGPVAIGYKYPDLFKIRVQYKGKDVGSKIKMCYLRNVQTSYNPTAASFHADGSPTEIDLSLAFTEHTTISRADVSSDAKSEFGGPPGGETSIVSFDQGDGY